MDEKRLAVLIERIAFNDDEQAFRELFENKFPGLLSFAFSITREKAVAEDLIQDAFVRIWQDRRLLPGIKNISGYIYTIVKYKCFNHTKGSFHFTKKRWSESNTIEDHYHIEINPENDLISRENLGIISEAINNLPAQCRLVFRLVKEEGLSYAEASRLLNISERTVNTHMTRAIKKITTALAVHFPNLRGK